MIVYTLTKLRVDNFSLISLLTLWVWFNFNFVLSKEYIETTLVRKKNETANIIMFSDMTVDYVEKVKKFTAAKVDYAQYHGYEFILFAEKEKNIDNSAFYSRIHSAKKLLLGKGLGDISVHADWIVYFDADAIFAEKKIPLTAILDIAENFAESFKSFSNTSCEFIAQDDGDVPEVNSGFWMVKNTTWGLEFIEAWIKETITVNDQHWDFDQGPLLSTILHFAAKQEGTTYDNRCWHDKNYSMRNVCWYKVMHQYGYKEYNKKIDKICLIPNQYGVPFRFHSHNGVRKHTEFLLHAHVDDKSKDIDKIYPGVLDYSSEDKRIIYPEGMLVKTVADNWVYIIEKGERRGFLSGASFLGRGYQWEDIVLMHPYALDRIPRGADIS